MSRLAVALFAVEPPRFEREVSQLPLRFFDASVVTPAKTCPPTSIHLITAHVPQ